MSLHVVLPSVKRIEGVIMNMNREFRGEFKRDLINSDKIFLIVQNICFKFDTHYIFRNENFKFSKGIYLITGKNGSGKSTLARIITDLLFPESGKIIINVKNDENAFGLVSQNPFLFDTSVLENLKVNLEVTTEALNKLLIDYELEHIFRYGIRKHVGENGKFLSGGEKQLVSILRGIIKNPDILILDEVTNNLPVKIYDNILKKIAVDRKDKITIVISHLPHNKIKFKEIINMS